MTMEDFRKTVRGLHQLAGVEQLVDLGVVAEGKTGYATCRASVGLERYEGVYFVWVNVVHEKSGGRTERVVKWPYSVQSQSDLDSVLADLRVVMNVSGGRLGPDERGWLGRTFDRIIGREDLGTYRFASPVAHAALKPVVVEASMARWGRQLEVTLSEKRKGGAVILAQLPHAACRAIHDALASLS